MEAPGAGNYPWRVRVHGQADGAGVLLDENHVLTCAHVIGEATGTVQVKAAGRFQDWERTARVVPGSWVPRTEERGDIALLRLDEPTPPEAIATRLWCAPLSRGLVRVSGYPESETGGIPVDAQLGGDGGRGGELGLLKRVSSNAPWIEEGFSGAGVVALEGEHADHVIGIVVSDYRNSSEGSQAAWMIPTETIRYYLPGIEQWVAGERADQLSPSSDGLPALPDTDRLRVALTRELVSLLKNDWAGTVVIPGGETTATGTAWLVRLVRTADPVARARTSAADLAGAPDGTSLPLGTIDAAYDARGKSADEIASYLARRFKLSAGRTDLADRLLHRDPPVSLVIANVDQAQSPGELIRDLARPLAAEARRRGVRLVLGFAGKPPSPRRLPHDVLLDPAAPSIGAGRDVTEAEAEERVAELATAEKAAAEQNRRNENRFLNCPTLPPARSQGLRAWLVAGSGSEDGADAAAIAGEAEEAIHVLDRFVRRSEALDDDLKELRASLPAVRVWAERYSEAEDQQLGGLYSRTLALLYDEPFDLLVARDLVQEYVEEIDRRRDEEERGV